MSRFFLVASLVAVVALAACSAAPIAPAPSPSEAPASPSAPPIASPPPEATPPAATPPPASPEPPPTEFPADFTADERYLLDRVLRGATDCEPAGGSDELPRDAVAGIECASPDPAVFRIGFYLFENDADMLAAYFARMTAEGVARDSGSCRDGEHEGAYTPGEGTVPYRHGCFVNDDGAANYRATLPGVHVYIGIYGTGDNMIALEDFAWLGNRDTPGHPTLWAEPS